MATATIRQVQHNLAGVLRSVEAGEEVEILRRNRPIARIVPLNDPSRPDVDWSGLRTWRARLFPRGKVRGRAASEVIYEGRGDR